MKNFNFLLFVEEMKVCFDAWDYEEDSGDLKIESMKSLKSYAVVIWLACEDSWFPFPVCTGHNTDMR